MNYRVGYTVYVPDANIAGGERPEHDVVVVEDATSSTDAINKAEELLKAMHSHVLVGSIAEPVIEHPFPSA